jgi:hypothetical protein
MNKKTPKSQENRIRIKSDKITHMQTLISTKKVSHQRVIPKPDP